MAISRELYLAHVRQLAEQHRLERESLRLEAAQQLTTAISAWYSSFSPNERPRRVTTFELAERFRAPASAIGLALFELGWRRKRDWRGDRPYARWWKPPDST